MFAKTVREGALGTAGEAPALRFGFQFQRAFAARRRLGRMASR